ncbi:MAG: hypothetical protein ABI665_18430 [Vicinamibacterales bacterium]
MPPATVTITQSHLVGLCLNGQALKGDRKWTSDERLQSIEFTMRNEPRSGIATATPGIAVVSFKPEAGHRYEVEVRAEPATFSTRVWARGQWSPVVRDRTTDRIVSGEPAWQEAACRRRP